MALPHGITSLPEPLIQNLAFKGKLWAIRYGADSQALAIESGSSALTTGRTPGLKVLVKK